MLILDEHCTKKDYTVIVKINVQFMNLSYILKWDRNFDSPSICKQTLIFFLTNVS